MIYTKSLNEVLVESGDDFNVGQGIEAIRGKTLTRTPTWLKAAVLVRVREKHQLRLYGWQKNKEGKWKVRQKFNISKGYAADLSEIIDLFSVEVID